jgi:hypothetical protein
MRSQEQDSKLSTQFGDAECIVLLPPPLQVAKNAERLELSDERCIAQNKPNIFSLNQVK